MHERKLRWLILAVILVACSRQEAVKPSPIELTRENACTVCGMIIMDFPGAKGQIHYRNGKVDPFCCTLDLLMFYLQPDRPRHITAIYVNDMGRADWNHPQDHWIDATTAWYVYGGEVLGPMGEALVPFSEPEKAEAYVRKNGGRMVRFDEITMEMLRPDAESRN